MKHFYYSDDEHYAIEMLKFNKNGAAHFLKTDLFKFIIDFFNFFDALKKTRT